MSGTSVDLPSPRREIAFGERSGYAYEWLKARILTLELAPGSFIDKASVAVQIGVSKQPVTVALGRLAREGWVDVVPQIGSYVARVPASALREQAVLWFSTLSFIVQHRHEAFDEAFLEQYRRRHEEMAAARASGDSVGFLRLDHQAQRSFVRHAGFSRPLAYVDRFFDLVQLFHALGGERFSAARGGVDIGAAVVAAHRDMHDALSRRDRSAAVRALHPLVELCEWVCSWHENSIENAGVALEVRTIDA